MHENIFNTSIKTSVSRILGIQEGALQLLQGINVSKAIPITNDKLIDTIEIENSKYYVVKFQEAKGHAPLIMQLGLDFLLILNGLLYLLIS